MYVFSWFSSNLNNRRKTVSTGLAQSEIFNVDFGEMQGTTWGPYFF